MLLSAWTCAHCVWHLLYVQEQAYIHTHTYSLTGTSVHTSTHILLHFVEQSQTCQQTFVCVIAKRASPLQTVSHRADVNVCTYTQSHTLACVHVCVCDLSSWFSILYSLSAFFVRFVQESAYIHVFVSTCTWYIYIYTYKKAYMSAYVRQYMDAYIHMQIRQLNITRTCCA